MKIMWRLVIALFVGGALTTAVAFAAGLGGISPEDLGAGESAVASCDSTGVGVEYTIAYSAGHGAFHVTEVTVTDVAAGCNTQTVDVELTDGGVGIGSATGAADADGTAGPFAVTGHPSAEDVDDVHVAIHE